MSDHLRLAGKWSWSIWHAKQTQVIHLRGTTSFTFVGIRLLFLSSKL